MERAALAALMPHALHQSQTSTLILEPWQVINLVGTVLLAAMFVMPVIEDLKRWRREMADRR